MDRRAVLELSRTVSGVRGVGCTYIECPDANSGGEPIPSYTNDIVEEQTVFLQRRSGRNEYENIGSTDESCSPWLQG